MSIDVEVDYVADMHDFIAKVAMVSPHSMYTALRDHAATWVGGECKHPFRNGPRGYCYYNSWKSARSNDNLEYCEGLAWKNDLPIALEHAWILDKRTGNVIDRTWRDVEDACYVGFVIPKEDVAESLRRSPHTYGVLASDWMRQGWFMRTRLDAAIAYTREMTV